MENNNNKQEWANRDVGALWKKEGKSQKYLSGYVRVGEENQEIKIVVFSNRNKNNEKAPDYRIYVSAQSSEAKRTVAPTATATAKTNVPVKAKQVQKQQEVEESEDIL